MKLNVDTFVQEVEELNPDEQAVIVEPFGLKLRVVFKPFADTTDLVADRDGISLEGFEFTSQGVLHIDGATYHQNVENQKTVTKLNIKRLEPVL